MSQKKKVKKCHYIIVAIPSLATKKIKEFPLARGTINFISITMVCLLTTVIILGMFVFQIMTNKLEVSKSMEEEISKYQKEISEYHEENTRLIKMSETLNEKIVVLSDNINQRVETEKEILIEEEEKSIPSGFPLSGTATMEEIEGDSAPIIIFKANEGTAVIASGDGLILETGEDEEYGNVIKIDHGNGYTSIYRCDSDYDLENGQEITRGTVLFNMEENEQELGYQIMLDGQYIKPLDVIAIDG